MTAGKIVAELKSLGSEQTRRTFARHGIEGDVFGVSYADLDKIAKRLKREGQAELCSALWESGNHDAKVLATKIGDPSTLSKTRAKAWVREAGNRLEACAFTEFVSRTPFAPSLAEEWVAASPVRSEWKVICGWALVAELALNEREHAGLKDSWFRPFLKRIRDEIHDAPNWVRYQMNGTLIAIGTRSESLHRAAVAAAKRVGQVEVDHGDTSCQTPDAIPYMAKAWDRKRKRRK